MNTTSTSYQKLSCAQREVLDSGLLSSGFSCILQMPTGSGKTWLAEQAIAFGLARQKRCIYLTPLKALAVELLDRWQAKFSDYEIGIFTGDFANGKYPVPFAQAQLLIMTPEKLDACTRNWRSHWNWIPEVDLVVVDEFHLLGDAGRGGRLEGTLSRFRRLNPFSRVLGLSATLGNRSELADWLDGVEYVSDQRPIPLQWSIERYKKAQQKPEILRRVVQANVERSGKSLVFVQSRRRAEAIATLLTEDGMNATHHHAGLDYQTRQNIETSFRKGELDVLVATATLEMGLNLPVRQVILYDLQGFDGVDFAPLSVNTVWQRAGRAGRQGLDTEGEVILVAPVWQRSVEDYALGQFNSIRSTLDSPIVLAEQVIAEVASGLCRSRAQLKIALGRTLAAKQGRLPDLNQAIETMIQAGMLLETDKDASPRLKATKLGYVATRHMVSPHTVLQFRQCLVQSDNCTFFDLLTLATSSLDCQPIIPVDFEGLDELAESLSQESSDFMTLSRAELVSKLGVDGKRLLAGLHTAMIVRMWTRTGDGVATAKLMGCYAFEVTLLQSALIRLLMAMHEVLRIINEEVLPRDSTQVASLERLQTLIYMVQHGIDEGVATLCVLEGIGGTLAKRLKQAGIEDIEDLALADITQIASVKGISRQRAETLIVQAGDIVDSQFSAVRYQEDGVQPHLKVPVCPEGVDLYRLRRASELTISAREGTVYRVIGGTDPHLVKRVHPNYQCDCADFAKGNLCKHILCVRLFRDDLVLKELMNSLGTRSDQRLDLLDLWMGTSL